MLTKHSTCATLHRRSPGTTDVHNTADLTDQQQYMHAYTCRWKLEQDILPEIDNTEGWLHFPRLDTVIRP